MPFEDSSPIPTDYCIRARAYRAKTDCVRFASTGDLDIVTNEFNSEPQVLISNLAAKKTIRFLKVALVGSKSNRNGIGATVTVSMEGMKITQVQDGKSGYLSQSVLPLYFGLGKSEQVDRIEVQWPSGERQTVLKPSPINTTIQIREGQALL